MKKLAFVYIVALMTIAAAIVTAGCSTPGTPTPVPSATPSAQPSQASPTGTPSPAPWLSGYAEYKRGVTQPVAGAGIPQVTCTLEAIYHNSDWTLPGTLRTLYGNAHHGAIYLLSFTNPSSSSQDIRAGDSIRSIVDYHSNGMVGLFETWDTFYDPATNAEYSTLTLAPGQSQKAYMIAYITNDSKYEQYASVIDELPSLDWNPHYSG